MNKISFSVLLFCALLAGCSSKPITTPTPEHIDIQEEALRQIHLGMSFKDASSIIEMSTWNGFEVLENNITYKLSMYSNHDTNISFSLFFVNDKLVSIISSDHASNLFRCRTPFNTEGKHWLSFGITPYADWIIQRNILNSTFNYRAHEVQTYVPKSKTHETLETAGYIAVYSPAIVIGAPFILQSWLSGELTEDEAKQEKKRLKTEFVSRAKLGTSKDDLIKNLGNPTKTEMVNGNLVFYYDDLTHTFGLQNDHVVWQENVSMPELYARLRDHLKDTFSQADCGNLRQLWVAQSPTR